MKKIFLFATMALMMAGCDSILDIDPPSDALTADQTFNTIEGINAAATGLYTGNFINNSLYTEDIDYYYAFLADELKATSLAAATYIESSFDADTQMFSTFWASAYRSIYQSNDILAHMKDNDKISENANKELQGEALWFRAYMYMFLGNSFGDVPLVLTTDPKVTTTMPRSPLEDVNRQIEEDLKLSAEYLSTSKNGNTRITTEAALALLARAYLYDGKWIEAVQTASKLIPAEDGGTGTKFYLETVERVFKASSKETILQNNMEGLEGTGTFKGYTQLGWRYAPVGTTVYYPLAEGLVADMLSEPDDKRIYWLGKTETATATTWYPFKYRLEETPNNGGEYEYMIYLRLAEQYLIRAEANAHLGNISEAVKDVNTIRRRAGLYGISENITEKQLLMQIEEERRKELFTEQGHRYFDLHRTGRSNTVYPATGYKRWSPEKDLLPVPTVELSANPNLKQNPGY